jgi:16S rRNA (guanine527-N7)-methyltransferase
LYEVIENLQLRQCKAVHFRAEEAAQKPKYRETFDLVVSRAVAMLPVLMEYSLPFVEIGGLFIAMKGPGVEKELVDSEKAVNILGGEIESVQRFVLPETDIERVLVLVRKVKNTPSKYPRASGKPSKQPL